MTSRHPHIARVHQHEAVAETVFARERIVLRPRNDGLAVGPVVNHRHARGIGAFFLDEAASHPIAQRDDGVGLAQQVAVDAVERAIHQIIVKIVEQRRHLREDVLAEKHEAGAGAPRRPTRGQPDNRRIGQRHDDVGTADVEPRESRRSEIREVVGRASREAPRPKARAVGAKNRHTVMRFAIHRRDSPPLVPRRVQRAAGHDGHLAAMPADEVFRQLGQELARGRLIGPVGTIEEADLHAGTLWLARCALYHAIVRLRPWRKSVDALKPNAARARLTSSDRRGWPSGLVGSNTRSP
jgi:hypothetical protein